MEHVSTKRSGSLFLPPPITETHFGRLRYVQKIIQLEGGHEIKGSLKNILSDLYLKYLGACLLSG